MCYQEKTDFSKMTLGIGLGGGGGRRQICDIIFETSKIKHKMERRGLKISQTCFKLNVSTVLRRVLKPFNIKILYKCDS